MRLYKNSKLTLALGHELTDEDIVRIKELAERVRPRFQQLMQESAAQGPCEAPKNSEKPETDESTGHTRLNRRKGIRFKAPPGYLSVSDLAQRVGFSGASICNRINAGIIPGVIIVDNCWCIPDTEETMRAIEESRRFKTQSSLT